MKIALIIPRTTTKGNKYAIPFGIGYISAVLKRAGHTVSIINLNHYAKNYHEKVTEELITFNPKIVATGGLSFSFLQLKHILTFVKKILPKARTIVGGMVITSQATVVFDKIGADVGVIGEAEETILPLVEILAKDGNMASVNGIIFRNKKTGQLVTTPPRPLIMDLDTLPWPDYEGMGADELIPLIKPGSDGGLSLSHHDNPRVMPIITSRGCPFKCTFCCYELIESRYRTRNLDHVMAEINYLIERFKINNLSIKDDLFSPKKSRLIDFCERIKPLNLHWTCSLRVTPVDADVLNLMRESGCKSIAYGIESLSPDILLSMKKKITLAQIEHTLKTTHDANLGIGANLIFFDPAETKQTINESLKWFTDNPQYIFRCVNVGFHPGTVIYEDAINKGIIKDKVKYLTDSKCEINATMLSDADYKNLSNRLFFTTTIIGITGRVLSLSENEDDTLSIEAVCPHCKKNNSYKNYKIYINNLHLISCRSCCKRYRLPILFNEKKRPTFESSFIHPTSEPIEQKCNYSASSGGMKLGRSLLNNVYIVSEVKASCLQATI